MIASTIIDIKPYAYRGVLASDKVEPIVARAEAKVTNASSFNKPVVVAKKSPVPFTPKTIEVSVDSGTAALQNALNNNIKGGSPSLQRLPEPEKTYVGNRYPANPVFVYCCYIN